MKLKAESKQAAIQKINQLLQETEDHHMAVIFLQAMDMVCDAHLLEMPEDAISANIGLDDYFGCDTLSMR